jgi:hypothetical protein
MGFVAVVPLVPVVAVEPLPVAPLADAPGKPDAAGSIWAFVSENMPSADFCKHPVT